MGIQRCMTSCGKCGTLLFAGTCLQCSGSKRSAHAAGAKR
jgi:hypothetical protein